MRGPSRFRGSVQILASTLAAFALASAVKAQQVHGNRPAPASTAPALQCYAIWPDTGSWPSFLPGHFILGANPIGGIGLRAAAVLPHRVQSNGRDQEDTLSARWRSYGASWSSYGRLFAPDSIYLDWFIPMAIYGPIGELYGNVHGDSLSGRAVRSSDAIPRVIPWLPIHGRSEPCPTGP